VSWGSSVLPNESIEYEHHRNCNRANSARIKIDIREEDEISNYEEVGDGQSDETQTTPKKESLSNFDEGS
jgi:hypothetical protein